jgi:hypothetical protein
MHRDAPWRQAQSQPRILAGLCLVAVLSLVMATMWVTRANATATVAPASARLALPVTTAPPPPPTTTTTAPPPPPTTTTTAPPPPPPAPAPAVVVSNVLPARGEATAWGCGPALSYLRAYADPKFQLVCPGDAQGHQAVTCISEAPCAPGQWMIGIADPCPAAYMNEAHNSWVLDHDETGASIPDGSTAIDPYGYCHS